MHRLFYKIVLFLSVVALLVYSSPARPYSRVITWGTPVEELEESRIFPFNYDRVNVHYDLHLDLADSAVSLKYAPLFRQYNLPFTGEMWEVVLHDALEKTDPDLSRQVTMLAEDEGVYINTGSKAGRQKFLREMLPVLCNTMLLERHLARIDRNRIPE